MYSEAELKVLLMKGKDYRKKVVINHFDMDFEVEIRPLKDTELTEILSDLNKQTPEKIREEMENVKGELSDEELETIAKDIKQPGQFFDSAVHALIKMCEYGIIDPELRKMVVEQSRWGIAPKIGHEIRKLTSVPPEELKDFLTA